MTCVGIFVNALYALCIETPKNVNQNKGKIILITFPSGRVSLDMSWRSGSFQLKNGGKQKSKNILRVETNQFCDI